MSNATARARLQEVIDGLRRLPKDAGRLAAPEVADALKEELAKDVAAGQSPDGTPWKPTKAGDVPLQGAMRHVNVSADGSVVLARLTGPEAKHHKGTARGRIQRRILPTRNLPQPLVRAAKRILGAKFREILGFQ